MGLRDTLKTPERNATIDIFRAFAIIGVVLYHFKHTIPFGLLGVDLFFVISGFLVGGLLINQYQQEKKIVFKDFFLRRGFKILPSYYFYLSVGGIIAFALYHESNPGLLPANWWPYLLFYMNFTASDIPGMNEWLFTQAWSLCVEEHFYVILPFIFISVQRFGNKRILIASVIGLILIGIISKVIVYFTVKQNYYFPTYARIDALAWGVLLNIFISYSDFIKKFKYKILAFLVAFILFGISLKLYYNTPSFYRIAVFHSLLPILCIIMIGALYYVDLSFTFLRPLRIVGYYSYNWYLWHPIVAWTVLEKMGSGKLALVTYLIISFTVAVLVTKLIEEPFLNLRKKLFSSKSIRAEMTFEKLPDMETKKEITE